MATGEDRRMLRVEDAASVMQRDAVQADSRAIQSGEFQIVDRYPQGLDGEAPDLIVAPGRKVTFK